MHVEKGYNQQRQDDYDHFLQKGSRMEYFKVTKASERVFRIKDPFGAICTLITGSEKALLADTGIGFGNIARAVENFTDLPVIAVNTHEHLDHSMGGRFFDRVYMDRRCREYLPVRNCSRFRQRVLELYMPKGPVPGFSEEEYYAYDYSNVCWTDGHEMFDLGDIRAELIPLPSHTPGSVGILLPELDLLLTGDSIAPLTSLMFEESLDPEKHAELLEEIKQYPFSTMLCAHSEKIMERSFLDVFIRFTGDLDSAESYRYRDSIYQQIKARTYIYHDISGESAALILRQE